MPTESERLLARLSRQADAISDEIERRQAGLDRDLARMEKELFAALQTELFGQLQFENGKLITSRQNLLLLLRVDAVFQRWVREFQTGVVRDFALQLLSVAAMTGQMYSDMGAEALVNEIAQDNTVLRAAIGIDDAGRVVPGSILYDVSTVGQVRQDVKNVILQAIRQGQTLREFSTALRDYVVSSQSANGRLKSYWRTYAYDLFNQAAEVKNEQFRQGLDLRWFIYVGDVIKDSRAFCVKKAGKIFAVVEADTEWPKDPDLIGKGSGVPYVPRIDRGRWNCRHRIRYIAEETARVLDSAKVDRIKEKYGSTSK